MSISMHSLQKGLYEAIQASAAIRALAGNPVRISDESSTTLVTPYLILADMSGTELDTKTSKGLRCLVTIDVWSKQRGKKEIQDIMAALRELLHTKPGAITVTGARVIDIQFITEDSNTESDGLTRRGFITFRVTLDEE